ncbi:MAG: flagellar biosynthesis protein FliQ [Oscillospiraceae bacterium]|nr:flagellar biosynthesis protein FliQ [Oscillospiraceae bacterium]
MSQSDVITVIQQGLYTILIVSAPLLGVSLIVGLIISLFQATTQIHEQTLAFAPKIISIFVAMIFFGPWMMGKLMDYINMVFDYMARIG